MTDTEARPEAAPATPALEIAYRRVRQNVAAVLDAHPPAPRLVVPHCPEWTVEELVGHLVEVCARVRARVTGTETTSVTGQGRTELLRTWERLSGPVDEYLSGPWSIERGIMVMDAFTHELDLRDALRVPPPADHPALPVATMVVVAGLAQSLNGRGLPALRIETERGRWTAGEGEPATTVAGPWYDVYLSLAGRRTSAQIGALRWSSDPAPWLPALTWGPFTVPAERNAAH
ncbi:maleylpyruvate isomerase family mycothiol-dependent enzyme [Phytohabitans kaempferiae]|uniref:Maleylpyruvate isomerase family mycothiol-dependent enzyme n=1 Tax=Phytohabitans kaempferiae TaxID=1620943 RepID=A0ABV6M566_9ACTN